MDRLFRQVVSLLVLPNTTTANNLAIAILIIVCSIGVVLCVPLEWRSYLGRKRGRWAIALLVLPPTRLLPRTTHHLPRATSHLTRVSSLILGVSCLVLLASGCAYGPDSEYAKYGPYDPHAASTPLRTPWYLTPEGEALLKRSNARQTPPGKPMYYNAWAILLNPQDTVVGDAMRQAEAAKAPYDACSIYGMDQSEWERINHPTREQKVFRSYYRGYGDRHQPEPRFRTKEEILKDPWSTSGDHATVDSGLNWEDLYQYEGEGQIP
jgi:hypothetical protein